MNRNNILRISTITTLGIALMTNATVGQSAKSDKERWSWGRAHMSPR
jgi:hypothetical protein